MNWAGLNKDQKQKVVLGGIVAVGLVYAAFNFALKPVTARWTQDEQKLEEIKNKLHMADRSIKNESKVRENLQASAKELDYAANQFIPPLENPLSWVAKQVYREAREVGIDIESVAELGTSAVPWSGEKFDRAFVPYAVRIVAQCGYGDTVSLIRAFEESNPYLCVSGVTVGAQERDFLRHRVTISLEWPIWLDPEGADRIRHVDEQDEDDETPPTT